MNIALLTAAGASTRMGQDIPKQFLTVNERPVIGGKKFYRHMRISLILRNLHVLSRGVKAVRNLFIMAFHLWRRIIARMT